MQGKSFIVAIEIYIRCILYPGTRIVVASGKQNFKHGGFNGKEKMDRRRK